MWTRCAGLMLVVMMALGGCSREAAPPTPDDGDAPDGVTSGGRLLSPAPTPGLSFALRDADPAAPGPGDSVAPVPGVPLAPAAVRELLDRLPPLPASEAVTTTFALKPGPQPPPLSGDTVLAPFPAPTSDATKHGVDVGPLSVLRFQPEGDVAVASHLAVTFDQPMVPLATHSVLAAIDVPVQLSPQPEGEWRWVGTQTLVFEPDLRFPMATEYNVVVPAGTASANGGTLAGEVSWTFRTPPPTLTDSYPTNGPTKLEPLVFVAFDQEVRPDEVLANTVMTAGRTQVAVRRATDQEVDADERVRALVAQAIDGRWVVLRAIEPLPKGAEVAVLVGPGLPSAEGPRVTEAEETFGFDVHAALAVTELSCTGGGRGLFTDPAKGCLPMGGWSIRFNNDLDPATVDLERIVVAPEVPQLRVEAHGNTLHLSGITRGQTKYKVQLPAELGDTFGQTLGEQAEVTFETGDAEPMLSGPGDEMVVLDPSGPRSLVLVSVNNDELDVTLYRVEPEDWPTFMQYANEWDPPEPVSPPGEQVWQGTVKPRGKQDALISVPVDLSPALDNGLGHVVAVVKPSGWQPGARSWANRPIIRWVQATELGLTSVADGDEILVWVTMLVDGTPVPGANVTMMPADEARSTDDLGLTRLTPLPERNRDWPPKELLKASFGNDATFIPGTHAGGWFETRPADTIAWYAFEDRGIYKPGETVHVKGWVRQDNMGKGGDLAAIDGGPDRIEYELTTPNGVESVSGTAVVDDLGGFDLAFDLPGQIELGPAPLTLKASGGSLPQEGREHQRMIRVSEFRRPEFEVSVSPVQPFYVAGDPAVVTARAAYFAGGALPGADVRWLVNGGPTSFSPPGHDGFQFGSIQPWWGRPDPMFEYEMSFEPVFGGYPPMRFGASAEEHQGVTDGLGEHHLAIDLVSVEPVGPVSFLAEATVEDVNRQAWTGSSAVLMHPAEHYVGLRTPRWFAEAGDEFSLDLIVADLEGTVVTGSPVTVRAEKIDWVRLGTEYVEDLAPAGTCDVASDSEPVTCTFTFDEPGEYRLTAEIVDDEGRRNRSALQISVAGDGATPDRGLSGDEVRLIPGQENYQPGDVAEILVLAPFASAEGLTTVQRGGIVRTERFSMTGASHTLRVAIDDGAFPNVHVQVELVGSATRDDDQGTDEALMPTRPAFASGTVELDVPPILRTLVVDAAPVGTAIEPGGTTTVDVLVLGADGSPVVDAGVALVVVDEAVWSLTGYTIPDPVEALYPRRWPTTQTMHQRSYVRLADPAALVDQAVTLGGGAGSDGDAMIAEMSVNISADSAGDNSLNRERRLGLDEASVGAVAPMAASDGKRAGAPPGLGAGEAPQDVVAERTNLNPLAAFLPGLRTDASGRVSAEVTVPDNVTRYRITAVATDGDARFGMGESTLTARLPLTVRPSAPRFLNFGDVFEMPVVVQNQTDAELEADVVVRGANLNFTADQGLRVVVPAGDRIEVRFPAAADMPGTAVLQAGVFGTDASDAQRVELPVWSPATTEGFATYGQIDEGAVLQPVLGPTNVITSFGGLALQTSSTALSELSDAYVYLKDYPFEGSEHVASRMVAAVALADVVEAFGLEGGLTRAEIDAAVQRDIDKLRGMQSPDGGFGWWSARERSEPFVSVHVTHALARAHDKGYTVPDDVMGPALVYLTDIESRLDPERYGEQARRTIRAYALFARTLAGDRDAAGARRLFSESDDHTIDTLGWLLFVMSGDTGSTDRVVEIRRMLNNRAAEEAGTAQFTESYDETDGNLVLASDRRSDAIVLEALIVDQPDNDLIPKVVSGLLGHRTKGRWASTQENAFVLLALDRYFRAFEGEEPDFLAQAWLGEGFLGEAAYRGRTPDRTVVDVPMAALAPGETTGVTLQKDGPGRLYFRLGLRYAPTDLDLDPLERGFSVTRVYEPIDDPADVRRTADGTWEIKPGARVRVRLTMVAPQRRYQVALVDPLPAGLEALNPDLATTGTLPPDAPGSGDEGSSNRYWWWRWFDHSAFRDERVEAFGGWVWPGVHEYSYVARATTPGTFVVPPAKAEEMYHPETFGRSGSDRVVVR